MGRLPKGLFSKLTNVRRQLVGTPGQPAELRGHVGRVIFSRPDVTIAVLETADGDVNFTGNFAVRQGETVVIEGYWTEHSVHGLQIKASSFQFDQALDVNGLARWLAEHPDMRGIIGERRGERLAETFGDDFGRMVVEEPEKIAEVAGISLEIAHKIRQAWLLSADINEAMVKLRNWGLTSRQIEKLKEKFNSIFAVVKFIDEDPYHIIHEVSGFGFKTVDALALRSGRQRTDPSRLRAGVLDHVHNISRALETKGDCWIHRTELVTQATGLLSPTGSWDADAALIERALTELVDNEKVVVVSHPRGDVVAEKSLYEAERGLADLFARRAIQENAKLREVDLGAAFLGRILNDEQKHAVEEAAQHNILCITGGAGSGKTFMIASILDLYRERGLVAALLAPTGKAADRLAEVVRYPASTIHRFFGLQKVARANGVLRDPDVIIVDEFSMVDVRLAWDLLGSLPESCPIVLVGDHNQLSSIGPGSVLRDIVRRRPIATVVLRDIVRQAGPLKDNAVAILSGQVRDSIETTDGRLKNAPWVRVEVDEIRDVEGYISDLFENSLEQDFGYDILRDVQVLTPQKPTPIGTKNLNLVIQQIVQRKLFGIETGYEPLVEDDTDVEDQEESPVSFFIGDRVINTVNNYETGVMNGEIGFVREVRGGLVFVKFDGDKKASYVVTKGSPLQLAYALTIHKFQGSEIPCAVVIMHGAHKRMHNKNLFYTAVTRAKKTAVIVGDYVSMQRAADTEEAEKRRTFMSFIDMPVAPGQVPHYSGLRLV